MTERNGSISSTESQLQTEDFGFNDDSITISNPSAPSEFLTHLPASHNAPFGEEASGQNDQTSPKTAGPSKVQVDSQGRKLNPRSCVTCRKRKVKCDKLHPCSNCNRAHIECVFPAPGRAPRKIRKVGDGRDKELLERLRRLEGVVKGLGVDVPGGSVDKDGGVIVNDAGAEEGDTAMKIDSADDMAALQQDGNNSSQTEPQGWSERVVKDYHEKWQPGKQPRWIEESSHGDFENRFGRLVVNEGKSRYINNSFWANLSNEVEDLKGILNQSSDEEEESEKTPGSNSTGGMTHQGFVFGFSSQNVDVLSLHPLPNQIAAYWETYKDRVDPLVKVLHIPSIEPTVLSAASHLSNLSKGFESLLFTIYYAAVTSLDPAQCQQKFAEEKPVLLARYRFGIEQALARANFLTTEEIVVLQAFVIFLICLRRNNDARVIWTLTGLVVRIAQTIGIHRDGSHFGLAPFEVEMRRRLWWQVCILDTRASEDHGCDPTIIEQAFDTKMPLNVNDVDITPEMKDFPEETQGCTDMSFCLIRFEVANTFRRINYVPPGPQRCNEFFTNVTLQDKERWITECHQRLEERYLKHCDMSVPLFWVTATVARLMMSKMWLMVYHPFQRKDGGQSLPPETKEKLFITSLENMEYSILLETESRTMKWGWLFKTYMQWHALAFMLSELCLRTTGDIVDRAWTAVDRVQDGRWAMEIPNDSRAGHLWRPLKKLYRKAKEARLRGLQEAALAKQRAGGALPPQRTYSPNANPMFDHPKRPRMVRAPLSAAQARRFTEGATFGQVPLDKHELFKSPKLTEANVEGAGFDNADVDAKGRPYVLSHHPITQPHRATPSGMQIPADGNGHYSFAGFPAGQAGPPMGRSFMVSGTANMDFSDLPSGNDLLSGTAQQNMFAQPDPNPNAPISSTAPQRSFTTPSTNAFNTPNSSTPSTKGLVYCPPNNNSNDNNTAGDVDTVGLPIYMNVDMDLDPSNELGDLDWQNWDQLVRQFGMDVDPTAPGTGMPADWAGVNWNYLGDGGGVGGGFGGGAGGGGRMGMGGDWF